jgi:hypothetical protein
VRLSNLFLVLALLSLAGSASAVTKTYDSSKDNGLPGDAFLAAVTLCPPLATTPNDSFGFAILEDDGTGTVTLESNQQTNRLTDLTPDDLTHIFGPGAFIFVDNRSTTTNVPSGGTAHVSTTGSGTAPGETAVWGIVSGWSISGSRYCISSPVSICNQNVGAHGTTLPSMITSGTFNLGTWAFDAVGDYEATEVYIGRTSNGGLTNTQALLRGAYTGSALPALPLIGFGALALSLAVIGARSLMGKK